MYVIRTVKFRDEDGNVVGSSQTLQDMTERQYNRVSNSLAGNDTISVRHVSAVYAWRWVKRGLVHETALYVDIDNRIRKARPGR